MIARGAAGGARLLALAALLAAGCRSPSGTVLVVVATLSGSLPAVAALDVTLSGPSSGAAQNQYARGGAGGIAFPTTFSAELPASVTGELSIAVRALDAAGNTLAQGQEGPFALRAGARQTVYVRLSCGGSTCLVDGGADGPTGGPDGGGGDGQPSCGNGRIDPGETCDTAIEAGAPGACPRADCDDGIPCTNDVRSGDGCTAVCRHDEIRTATAGDGCCPAGARAADDPDCSPSCGNGAVERGETCDTALAPGVAGACPSASDCADGDACTQDLLISASTCAAICLHRPETRQSGAATDGCCPAGAWHAVDADCPIACGNGIVEEGETCDLALPAAAGGCPASCDDGDPCTVDFLDGTACRATCAHQSITALVSGDGCCPAGGTRSVDADCPAACGNGVVEPGESCDKAVIGPSACPSTCPAAPACVRRDLAGSAADCTARCETSLVAACAPVRDGCCPAGCTAASDPDCSPSCGNGLVEAGARETCDTAIARGLPGACPTACTDGNPCTQDLLVGAGTCHAACVFLPVTAFRAGDGCCPAGDNFALDPDCAPVCGDGVAETPTESCDFAAAGTCPGACPPAGACARVRLEGAAASCDARCVTTLLTACATGDGCCPPGCTAASDGDCPPVCGDGVVETGERCDRGITAGLPGSCPPSCDDHDACTTDFASGVAGGCSRVCTHARVTACRDGDGCCPPGCSLSNDGDCGPTCGDGKIGAGETCDPPASCPTSCPDDGDRCTRERITGDAAHCDAACEHVPITACSGSTADLCCPTGCTPATDVDC